MGSPAPTTAGSELLHLLLLVPLNPLYICQDNLLCQFSIASITNYHKFWDLIQIYYITVLYVRSLTCISLDLEQGVGRAAFPSGSSRKESVYLAFLASRDPLHSLAHGPLPPLRSQQSGLNPHVTFL